MCITKETIWQLPCRCHEHSYAVGPVLIHRFHLTQGSFTPNNPMGRVKTMWEPCLFQGRPPVPLKKVPNGDIWFYTDRDWNQGCCHGNNIAGVTLFLMWCTFLVPSLKITAPIFLEIFLTQYLNRFRKTIYDVITSLLNPKTWISLKRKEIFQKGKRHSPLLWKAFQISSNYFLLHRRFNIFAIFYVKSTSFLSRVNVKSTF